MRLPDRVACCHAPLLMTLDRNSAVPFEVTAPSRFAAVMQQDDSVMSSLLDHVRFRFDTRWAAYVSSLMRSS